MAQYDRMAVLNAILDVGVVPVFYHQNAETVISIIEACARGGARAVEFTNRGDLAHHVFAAAMQHIIANKVDVILGVGSVVDAPTAALYIGNGANFVVGPCSIPRSPASAIAARSPTRPDAAASARSPGPKSWVWRSSRFFRERKWVVHPSSKRCWGPVPGPASCPPEEWTPAARAWRRGSGPVSPASASVPP